MDHLLDDAAVAAARRLAAELDRHVDRDLFTGADPQQVDMQHVLEKRVPLDVLQQGLAAGGAVQVDHLGAVAKGGFQLIGGKRQAHRFFAVAVQHGRQPARPAQPHIVSFADGFSIFDVK